MELVLLVLLVVLNGIFAMAEIAVIAAKEARLQKMVNDGQRGAASALNLKGHATTFLSTVQVGITMVGILSGAVGEKALVRPLAEWLGRFPLLQPHGETLAMVAVVIGLTYFSVVAGELVPKHLGLLAPEKIAALVSPPMRMLAHLFRPLVWFLGGSSRLLLRLAGVGSKEAAAVTDEEIGLLMDQGAKAGVFHSSEKMLVANVLRLDEQPVVAIMTHRQDIHALDLTKPEAEIRAHLAACPYSRLVACRGGLDNVVGLLRTADLLKAALACAPLEIEQHLRPPLYVPEYVTTTQLLESLRKVHLQSALIVDEYGDIQGFVTLTDVLTAIVGEVPSSKLEEDQEFMRREDGSWLVDGGVLIERVKAVLEITRELPGERSGTFHTLGGFMIHVLGRIPKETDHFTRLGYRFEVVDMDTNRIDKVLISRVEVE